MKLLIITCLKEYRRQAGKLLKQAGIAVFSATDVVGKKDGEQADLIDNWFSSGDEEFESSMLFSFTGSVQADQAFALINEYNKQEAMDYPIRAFLLPVEKANAMK